MQGVWSGVLRAGALSLRLQLVVEPDGAVTLVSLDEGAEKRRASEARVGAGRLEARFADIAASFNGRLADGRLEGRWRQGGNDLPLTLVRGDGSNLPAPPHVAPLTQGDLAAWRAAAQIPALGAAVARRGGAPRLWVDGLRSSRASVEVTPDDQWHWGSITKSMTATLIARHVAEGVLAWDATVGAVLGPTVVDLRPEYADVTLLELLSHRSGLPANLGDKMLSRFSEAQPADSLHDRLAFASAALRQPPASRRGEFAYSNSGYVAAAAMLEARVEQSWEALIAERLFRPLGLTSAGFGAPGRPGALDQPLGHVEPAWTLRDGRPRDPVELGGRRPADNVAAMRPAGGAHMNLADMLTYLAAHRDANPALLPAEGWARLHTPAFGGDYALGLIRRPNGQLWHNGSNTLWYGEILIDPSAGQVSAAVANDGVQDATVPVVGRVLAAANAAGAA